ncbi:MAG: ABC transporter permease, partial [Propionibacteriaceae bacterium]
MSALHRSVRWLSRFGAWALNTTIVLFGVSILAFILTCLTPGDLAENILTSKGIPPTAEMVAATRANLGLDRPLVEQYITWLGKLFTGDLGMSLSAGTQISSDFAMRTPLTLALTFASLISAWLIAIPVAMTAAAKKGGLFDRIARFLSYLGSALPGFVVALTVLYVFSLKLRLFPISATRDAHGLAMPVITMVIATCGWYTRQIRTIAVEEYDKPYVDGLRVRGMTEVRIARHVLRNIAAPLVTLAGNSFGALLAGSAVVEAIFNWHGLGQYALSAITMKDYPVIQAYVVWCAFAFLISNALADVAAFLLDPRLAQHAS